MKRPPLKFIALAGAIPLGLGALWWVYHGHYAGPRAELDREIERVRAELERKSGELDEGPQIRKRLAELAEGSLGDTEERVSVALRTALNEIAADCGLANPRVDTSDAEAVRNPAAKAAAAEFSRKELRDRTDFFVMTASFRGVGTLQQAMKALATIQSQSWARRVERVELKPVGGKDRTRMEIALKLSTLYMPDLKIKPRDGLWSPPAEALLAAAQPVVMKNIFREPPPVPAVAAKPPPPPPAPPSVQAPPYGEWRVTGVVRGAAGPELWVVNEQSKQSLTLAIGQAVLDAVFVGSSGENVRLKIGDQEFEVGLAQTLQERRVVSR